MSSLFLPIGKCQGRVFTFLTRLQGSFVYGMIPSKLEYSNLPSRPLAEIINTMLSAQYCSIAGMKSSCTVLKREWSSWFFQAGNEGVLDWL